MTDEEMKIGKFVLANPTVSAGTAAAILGVSAYEVQRWKARHKKTLMCVFGISDEQPRRIILPSGNVRDI